MHAIWEWLHRHRHGGVAWLTRRWRRRCWSWQRWRRRRRWWWWRWWRWWRRRRGIHSGAHDGGEGRECRRARGCARGGHRVDLSHDGCAARLTQRSEGHLLGHLPAWRRGRRRGARERVAKAARTRGGGGTGQALEAGGALLREGLRRRWRVRVRRRWRWWRRRRRDRWRRRELRQRRGRGREALALRRRRWDAKATGLA